MRIAPRATVASLAVLGLVAAIPVTTQAEPDRAAPTAPTRAVAGHPDAKARGAIDTSNRNQVARAYRQRMGANLSTSIGWTGSDSRCRAGHPSARAQRATLESINFVRAMAQVAPVEFRRKLSSKAQKAALIMSAQGSLSHDPPRSWKCWSKVGANAAGHSNLALSWPRITAGGLVQQYMDDDGSGNIFAGHRRWILNPDSVAMGSGTTSTANALWVLGPTRAARPDPAWMGWPTAGWFPSPLEPGGRWSLSAGDDSTDFSHARVTVRKVGGARLDLTVHPVAVGYGPNTVVFDVKGVKATGAYRVKVRGIREQGRGAPFAHQYTVRLFSPQR